MKKNKLVLLSFIFLSFGLTPMAQNKVPKIVIDAGHGGKDPGAIGFISNEKDINLAVSLRLGKMIADSARGKLSVVYTRTEDTYPRLKERHAIANNADGDLFISIHVNATPAKRRRVRTGTKKKRYKVRSGYIGKGKKRRRRYVWKTKTVPVYKTVYEKETQVLGTETYVLGLHRMDQKEEAIVNFSDNYGDRTGLLNMSDPATLILIQQYSQRFLGRSVSLANKIQNNFAKKGRVDKGVKQKGLEVLAGSAMPGVLVELGFINNREEEAYLNSSKGVHDMAHAMYVAILDYYNMR